MMTFSFSLHFTTDANFLLMTSYLQLTSYLLINLIDDAWLRNWRYPMTQLLHTTSHLLHTSVHTSYLLILLTSDDLQLTSY